jgi:prevent-host-death family protein
MTYPTDDEGNAYLTLHEARAGFADMINRAAYRGERIALTRRGKVVAALVPADDLELLQRVEDDMDIAEAEGILARIDSGQEGTISIDEFARELGL